MIDSDTKHTLLGQINRDRILPLSPISVPIHVTLKMHGHILFAHRYEPFEN